MTPEQIANLLTEDLRPGDRGVINEAGQFIVHLRPIYPPEQGPEDLTGDLPSEVEFARGKSRPRGPGVDRIVADLVEEDPAQQLLLVGVGPGSGPRSSNWWNAQFKRRHPNFFSYDNSEWDIYKQHIGAYQADRDRLVTQKLAELRQEAQVEVGAGELPSEAEFTDEHDPLVVQATNWAIKELRGKYAQLFVPVDKMHQLLAPDLRAHLNRKWFEPYRPIRPGTIWHFQKIFTIKMENVVKVERASAV